jgi:hypothetical protein
MKRRKPPEVLPPPRSREQLEAEFGTVWDTSELAAAFVITAILGNEIVVRRKADNAVGTLTFQRDPPLYFHFIEASPPEGDATGGTADER